MGEGGRETQVREDLLSVKKSREREQRLEVSCGAVREGLSGKGPWREAERSGCEEAGAWGASEHPRPDAGSAKAPRQAC